MKHKVLIPVPATTREHVDKITCDLCGCGIKVHGNDIDRAYVYRKSGYVHRDSGSGRDYGVDMCPDCFDKKLVPWLRAQGAEPYVEEWDW